MKKIASTIITIAIICCIANAGKQSGTTIRKLVDPSKEATKKTKAVSGFLEDSVNKYKDIHNKLKNNEKQMHENIAKSKNESDKVEVSVKFLNERLALLEQVEEDMKFVGDKLSNEVKIIHSMIGGLAENVSAAEELANQTKKIDNLIQQSEAMQRKYRELKSKEPDEDSDEYMKWMTDVNDAEIAFAQLQNQVQEAVLDEHLYRQIANGLNMTKLDTVLWRNYTGRLTALFKIRQNSLASSKRRTEKYRDYLVATKTFADAGKTAAMMKKMSEILGEISKFEMPPVKGIGDLKPPKIEFDTVGIGSADVRTEVKKYREKLQAAQQAAQDGERNKGNKKKK